MASLAPGSAKDAVSAESGVEWYIRAPSLLFRSLCRKGILHVCTHVCIEFIYMYAKNTHVCTEHTDVYAQNTHIHTCVSTEHTQYTCMHRTHTYTCMHRTHTHTHVCTEHTHVCTEHTHIYTLMYRHKEGERDWGFAWILLFCFSLKSFFFP